MEDKKDGEFLSGGRPSLLKDGAVTMTTDTSSVSGGMMDDDDVMEEDQEQEDGELWSMGESFWCLLCDDGGNLLLYVAKLIIVIATSSHAYRPLYVVPKKKSTVDFWVLQSSFGFLRRDDEIFSCLGVSSLRFFVPIATEPLLVDQLVTSFY